MPASTPPAKPAVIWLVLIALTLIAVGVFEGRLLTQLAPLIIVSIAAFKSRLVIVHYMEVAQAPGHWRFLYETWVFVAAAIIIIGHYVTVLRAG